ncbi:hypothetical protein MKX08_007844 [Trichoderma sp. CBMAI-0020]|nr:hypothetical protein MKX08_007844 [Trichoderma sp. CBMAI-0020]
MSFSSLESPSPDNGGSILVSQIEDKMKCLKIAISARHTSTQTGDNGNDEIDEKKFEMVGESFSQKAQAGILYVLEHTKIPGLFKIGRSKLPQDVRRNQNCYKTEIEDVYATKEPFLNYARAENLALKILRHKRLLIVRCIRCTKTHQEWFLATKEEIVSVVELAERWFKMPTYELHDGVCKLTPEADAIHKKMFRFSVRKMNELMNETYGSNNAFRAMPDAASTAAAPESGASAERTAKRTAGKAAGRAIPRFLSDESPDITLPPRYNTRARSPAARNGVKGERPFLETEETFEMHRRWSRETTPDGDGNYKLVTELEIKRTIRTKVSVSEFSQGSGVCDFSKPVVFGSNGEKEGRTEVKVEEVEKV